MAVCYNYHCFLTGLVEPFLLCFPLFGIAVPPITASYIFTSRGRPHAGGGVFTLPINFVSEYYYSVTKVSFLQYFISCIPFLIYIPPKSVVRAKPLTD